MLIAGRGASFKDGVAAGKVFQKAFSCCNAILETGSRPRSKHEKPTAGSTWEAWTVAAAYVLPV
jgi:hypothetical protein